ncbi:MAG: SRPBCC family protein [Gilvibacter sp.]
MKFLKYLLFIILIVIIAGAVYFGAKDGKFDASTSRTMQIPAAVVYEQVNDYTTWQDWGPWMEIDPEVKVTMGDTTAGVGANYSWQSEHIEVGDGSMKTIATEANKSIDQEITFDTPFGASTSDVYWKFESVENSTDTKVTWGMKGEFSLIEKIFMSFNSKSFDETLQEMYNTGLENLEQTTKASMEQHTVTFDGISEYGGGYYMYVTASTTAAGLGAKMAPMMGKVYGYMQANNIKQSGMPFTIYNQVDSAAGTMIFSTAIPVKERIITIPESEVLCGYMPPLTAVKTTLMGNYNNLDKAYARGLQYIQEKGLTINEEHPMFEIYVSDPGEVPNPSNWETAVYIPIVTPQETIN